MNRDPKGQPTGGQFAPSKNPESDVDLAELMKSGYENFKGETVGDLRRVLEFLPEDEPLLYWVRTRSDVEDATSSTSERNFTPEQWMGIYDKFQKLADYLIPWGHFNDLISEAVDDVVGDEDDDPGVRV